MLLCPNCNKEINSIHSGCSSCSWKARSENNVHFFLSSEDEKNPVFQKYQGNYDKIAEDDLEVPFLDNRYVEIQAEKIVSISPELTGKVVCDLGSGRGFLLEKIKNKNPLKLIAVDIAFPYLETFGTDVDCYLANAENLPFKDHFDVIMCTDVMEHVLNVGSLLHSLNTATKMDGHVVIRVPYRENLLNYSRQSGCKYEFAHLRDFNKKNLQDALEGSGFKVKKFKIENFSLQTPQSFWTKTQKRMNFYTAFQKIARKFLSCDSDINLYPSLPLRFFMKPYELVVVAQKKRNL